MSDYNTILVATDFSEVSDRAVDKGASLAKQLNAELHIVHIVQIHAANMPVEGSLDVEALDAREEKDATEQMAEDLQQRCQGMDVKTHFVHGDPAEQIIAKAEELNADLIVMGTQGRTGLAHLVMGSVAESVIKTSKLPVMCICSS